MVSKRRCRHIRLRRVCNGHLVWLRLCRISDGHRLLHLHRMSVPCARNRHFQYSGVRHQTSDAQSGPKYNLALAGAACWNVARGPTHRIRRRIPGGWATAIVGCNATDGFEGGRLDETHIFLRRHKIQIVHRTKRTQPMPAITSPVWPISSPLLVLRATGVEVCTRCVMETLVGWWWQPGHGQTDAREAHVELVLTRGGGGALDPLGDVVHAQRERPIG